MRDSENIHMGKKKSFVDKFLKFHYFLIDN